METIKLKADEVVSGIRVKLKLTGIKKVERSIKRLAWFIRVFCKPLNVEVVVDDTPIEANNKEAN